ncbi:glycoside hydrolase family 13 protein [Balneola sp. MJW-20]|uniref:glycoside hydrolase family 13 protein n=1 Tax=Gracilimonas aurantiaca TaxID=3234185 RepID=UPI003465A97C
MKRTYFLFLLLLIPSMSAAQNIERIEPSHWWAQMPVQELQITLYGKDIGLYRAAIDYPGVEIRKQISVDSPNYLFIYLDVSKTAEPGTFSVTLTHHNKSTEFAYELRPRETRGRRNMGFDASDVIYLMMPDRFANGDPSNDSIEGMLEKARFGDLTRRQGGDIQGVINNLNYLDELGMTAVWFTPMFENDMTAQYGAYHGYAATDLYKVDPRFGSNELYKALVDSVHERGMKVIMDMIHNHIGDKHWWMKDLPTADWVHDFERFGQTNFRGSVASDPYASEFDQLKLTDGWFVPEMPDLNQNNELLADYLIQNTLWWIEYSGVDGIRMDTYVYPDKDYMAKWSEKVLEAYPDFNIVGEAWVNTVSGQSFWQENAPGVDDGYDSNLPSLTDFNFSFAVRDAFTQDFGWQNGLSRLYYFLSQDFVYHDPMKNVTFLDNHDMSRFYEHIGKEEDFFKMALVYLMTTRGIPQLYYGTELMMGHTETQGDDEAWRQTMPGGWPEDERSVFTKEGRTDKENEIFELVRTLAQWRKTAIATHEGKLVHFIPENGLYVYFRVHDEQTIMVALNSNEDTSELNENRYNEILSRFTSGYEIISGEQVSLNNIQIEGRSAVIIELKN